MKYLISIFIFLAPFLVFSKNCIYSLNEDKSKIKWTAYKTPEKVAVGGSFNKVMFTAFDKEELSSFLNSANFTIDASTVNSNNEARDAIISSTFFNSMTGGPFIKGYITKVLKKKVKVLLTMNGVSKEIVMDYKYKKKLLKIDGVINVLNFTLNSNLNELAKACASKHKGKTWSEVKIEAIVSVDCL